MDFDESPAEAAFRAEARAWLEANAPRKGSPDDFSAGQQADGYVERSKAWQARLHEAGWTDLRGTEASIFAEEQSRFGVTTGLFAVSLGMARPTIEAHGTDEQKARFLPPLLRGEEVWCQLFSEPGAGSDLAGLACRAVLDGDEYVVNGQKVWTSGAHNSDWAILLARTDPDAPKHRGITYFLMDMHDPGVDIRPLRQMTGASHFNEVFLTDVRVPTSNVLGEVNGGWAVAMTTLANERAFIGGGGTGPGFGDLVELARTAGRSGDAVVRQGIADAYTRTEILRYLGMRARSGGHKEASVMKLFYATHLKRTGELALSIAGPTGTLRDGPWQQQVLSAPSIRIAGGSDEVQRNIMGERVLGLPGEPRPDKSVPWRQLLGSTG